MVGCSAWEDALMIVAALDSMSKWVETPLEFGGKWKLVETDGI
jgi:hypothetical protein